MYINITTAQEYEMMKDLLLSLPTMDDTVTDAINRAMKAYIRKQTSQLFKQTLPELIKTPKRATEIQYDFYDVTGIRISCSAVRSWIADCLANPNGDYASHLVRHSSYTSRGRARYTKWEWRD